MTLETLPRSYGPPLQGKSEPDASSGLLLGVPKGFGVFITICEAPEAMRAAKANFEKVDIAFEWVWKSLDRPKTILGVCCKEWLAVLRPDSISGDQLCSRVKRGCGILGIECSMEH